MTYEAMVDRIEDINLYQLGSNKFLIIKGNLPVLDTLDYFVDFSVFTSRYLMSDEDGNGGISMSFMDRLVILSYHKVDRIRNGLSCVWGS